MSSMLVMSENRLKRRQILDLLGELEAASGEAGSLYLPPDSPAGEIAELASKVLGPEPVTLDLARVLSSRTGAVLFWGESYRLVVLPPFPIKGKTIFAGYFVAPLRTMLEAEFTIGLVLLRLGAYAVGVFQGEKLVASKVGTGLVHARHRQGGSSQARFARHREKQMEAFFSRVCGHMREQIEPYLGRLDYLVYGGERFTLAEFQKQCPFSKLVAGRSLPYRLDVRRPRQATLEAAIAQVWTSRVIRWQESPEKPALPCQTPGKRY
ncbi:MAG: Vms1/Ankzf1 family peptidyl-tRNA hydrolase [Chloroflexota bacterium]